MHVKRSFRFGEKILCNIFFFPFYPLKMRENRDKGSLSLSLSMKKKSLIKNLSVSEEIPKELPEHFSLVVSVIGQPKSIGNLYPMDLIHEFYMIGPVFLLF